jgi:hypothetical protein
VDLVVRVVVVLANQVMQVLLYVLIMVQGGRVVPGLSSREILFTVDVNKRASQLVVINLGYRVIESLVIDLDLAQRARATRVLPLNVRVVRVLRRGEALVRLVLIGRHLRVAIRRLVSVRSISGAFLASVRFGARESDLLATHL